MAISVSLWLYSKQPAQKQKNSLEKASLNCAWDSTPESTSTGPHPSYISMEVQNVS